MNYFNYEGPIDPSPLEPKIGKSFIHIPALASIVDCLNQWQFKSAMDSLEDYLSKNQANRELYTMGLRLKGEVLINFNEHRQALECFEDILQVLPQDIQSLSLCASLCRQLEIENKYLTSLRQIDLMIYLRLSQVLRFIEDNMECFDLELGRPDYLEVDTLALFGNRFEDDGSFSLALLERIHKTLDLARSYPHSRIIVSGGAALSPFLEADRMEEWLINQGISLQRIYKDSVAKDTVGNAIGIVEIMKELRTATCIAITSLTHLPRAWMSLVVQAQYQANAARIYAAAPELPNSLTLPDDERLYMFFTVLKSAGLVEYRDFLLMSH